MAKRARCFFAIRPDDGGLDFLTDRIQLFRARGWERFGRFIPAEDIHLTLRFLGEVEPGALEDLTAGAREIAGHASPARYEIGRCVLFPRVSRARIIAARITPSDELKQLQAKLEQLAVDCGLEQETRVFRPHITIARLKKGLKRPNLPSRPGTIGQRVESFRLLESRFGEAETVAYREGELFSLGEASHP